MDQETQIAHDVVERAQETYSKQPRLDPSAVSAADASSYVLSIANWVQKLDLVAPEYIPDSRKRDRFMRESWRREPHMAGVVNQLTLLDSNRGWTLLGGRNQVLRFSRMFKRADDQDWRYYARRASLSHWVTDMNSVTELGRDGEEGPVRAIYHVDSARCRLVADPEYPLRYYPARGRMQKWRSSDFVRTASMPSDDENYHGLGYCFMSRAYELLRILIAVLYHDQEAVLARMPKGLLLLQNISQQQWEDAMESRQEEARAHERRYYGGISVIATMGSHPPDAKLVALSELPANFTHKDFYALSMYALALCAGMSPEEFWVVAGGALGRGKESENQRRMSSSKGISDFTLSHQDAIQSFMPESLEFSYDERDTEGEMLVAEVADAYIAAASRAYESGLDAGQPLWSREEARSWLVQNNIMPADWTETEEESQATDDKNMRLLRERCMESPAVQRALVLHPQEPIVLYQYPRDRVVRIYDPAQPVRRYWEGFAAGLTKDQISEACRLYVERQDDVLYQGDLVTITEQDVDRALANGTRRVGRVYGQLVNSEELPEGEIAE